VALKPYKPEVPRDTGLKNESIEGWTYKKDGVI